MVAILLLKHHAQVISAGGNHSLFLCPDSLVYGMGWDSYGQLGDSTTNWKTTPVQTIPSWNGKIKSINAGYLHSLFLKTDGTVWSTGYSGYGELGIGLYGIRYKPVQAIPSWGGPIVEIAGGSWHSLFLRNDGSVWAAGGNYEGELGDSTTVAKLTAVQVKGVTGIVKVAAGNYHSLFVKNDGSAWACGDNFDWQLGDTSGIMNAIVPVKVLGVTNVINAAGGKYHSLFLKSDSTVWAVGSNGSGQLGDSTFSGKRVPVKVRNLNGIISISAGWYHSLFLKSDGTVWACGYNGNGQLGDSTTISRSYPIKVSGLSGIIAISAGTYHSIFFKNDGTIWGTGYNVYGQLGDSTTIERYFPVQTINLCSSVSLDEIGYSRNSFFFPNPASDKIFIECMGLLELRLVNSIGEVVLLSDKKEIDVRGLSNGVYFLSIKNDKGTLTKKLIIQH